MDAKNTEWRPGPAVCRCCLTEGCYKDISTEYFWMGKREVYAEMLSDTFNVTIAYSQSGGPNSNSRLICEPCISRLRDACDFRRQVVECEKTFMQHLDPGSSTTVDIEAALEPLESEVKLERIKLEKRLSDDDFDERDYDDDDDDDLDDEPLTKLASKIPKKETVDLMDLLDNTKAAEKRKSSTKTKASPAKKAKIVKKETPKATASKVPPKNEKKKKELSARVMAKRNAEVVLQYSTVYPFRLRRHALMCVYCEEGYEDPIHFRRHVDVNHKRFSTSTAFAHIGTRKDFLKVDCTNLACRICTEPFSKVEDVAEHLVKEHNCKIRLDFEIALQTYQLEKGNWVCILCDERLKTLTQLCRHMTMTHYQKFTCDECGRTYMTPEALTFHKRCRHTEKEAQLLCRKCWQEFPTIEARKEHQRTSSKCWSYCCMYCGERFQTWNAKNKHLVEKHNCPEFKYECTECAKTFDKRDNFNTHFRKYHIDPRFTCSCGMKCGSLLRLEKHKPVCIGTDKIHQCEICSKGFVRKFHLRQHMWIHSERKPYECKLCNKPFNQKVNFKLHMRVHHPDIPELDI